MWIKLWILSLVFGLPTISAAAQGAGSSYSLSEKTPEIEPLSAARKPWRAELTLELRAREDRVRRAAQRSRQNIHELSLGGTWEFDENAHVMVEVSVESLNSESSVFIKQAYLHWNSWLNYVDLRLGRQFLPVGLINERDNWFSSQPQFFNRLLTTEKAIDLGAVLDLKPLGSKLLFLQTAQFAGRLVRDEEGQDATPERAPTIFSLKSESKWHSAFISKFDHDLAFYDAVSAWGAGGEVRLPKEWDWGGSLLAEYWLFDERQMAGPTQKNRSFLLNAEARFKRLALGQRYSESRGEIAGVAPVHLALEKSSLYYADFEIVRGVHIRGERVISVQDQSLRDELIGRALAHVTW